MRELKDVKKAASKAAKKGLVIAPKQTVEEEAVEMP